MLGVLLLYILTGLRVAVGLSLILLLARASRPRWTILGRRRIDEVDDPVFQSMERHPDAEAIPGVLIDGEAITDIDSTAIGIIDDLQAELASEGIELWTARVRTLVSDMVERFGEQRVAYAYPMVRAAAQACEARHEGVQHDPALDSGV